MPIRSFRLALLAGALVFAMPAFAQHPTPAVQPADAVVKIGDLEISGAFSRATLPNAPVAGGFLTIRNTGAADDRLIAAAADIAGEMQLHEMAMDGDVMRMRELPDGIPLPGSKTVVLRPGGLHVMFMDLKQPLVEGTSVPVSLTFEKAGTVTIEMSVGAVGADAPAHSADASQAHQQHPPHGAAAAGDFSHLSDHDAIRAMQKAMFDSPENPLESGPVVISGEFAVSDWAQGGMGGRALLRKTAEGWRIHLCSGAALKDAAKLAEIGVPAADAESLAVQLAEAEAGLDAETVRLYDSFDGTMMIDEGLI